MAMFPLIVIGSTAQFIPVTQKTSCFEHVVTKRVPFAGTSTRG
jgi:hypothetical protein